MTDGRYRLAIIYVTDRENYFYARGYSLGLTPFRPRPSFFDHLGDEKIPADEVRRRQGRSRIGVIIFVHHAVAGQVGQA